MYRKISNCHWQHVQHCTILPSFGFDDAVAQTLAKRAACFSTHILKFKQVQVPSLREIRAWPLADQTCRAVTVTLPSQVHLFYTWISRVILTCPGSRSFFFSDGPLSADLVSVARVVNKCTSRESGCIIITALLSPMLSCGLSHHNCELVTGPSRARSRTFVKATV